MLHHCSYKFLYIYFQVLTKEYYALQTSMEKRTVELESHVAEKKAKLETYEKVEKELDDIVLQAAES